jgi:hypothetical protein
LPPPPPPSPSPSPTPRLQLRTLNLVETGLEADGCAALCQALPLLSHRHWGPLRRCASLLLNANSIGDAGLAALASALRDGGALPALTVLGLGSNYISDEGVAHLVGAWRGADAGSASSSCRRLRRLNLAFNFVTHEGARALVGAVAGAVGDGDRGDSGSSGSSGADGGEGGEVEEEEAWSLDLYLNEIRGKERQALQAEVKALLPQLECIL